MAPNPRASSGIGALPQGAARYGCHVEASTTTTRAPAQIYQTRLAEVAPTTAEMERVKVKTGFATALKAHFAFVDSGPKSRLFKTEREVLDALRAAQARIAPALPALFSRTLNMAFEVRATEAFRAASASAQYSRGTADGLRAGILYVPILDSLTFNAVANPATETLFLHEAIPGHHYQLSLQRESTGLPKFRRFDGQNGPCTPKAWGRSWACFRTRTNSWAIWGPKSTGRFVARCRTVAHAQILKQSGKSGSTLQPDRPGWTARSRCQLPARCCTRLPATSKKSVILRKRKLDARMTDNEKSDFLDRVNLPALGWRNFRRNYPEVSSAVRKRNPLDCAPGNQPNSLGSG